MSNEIVLLLSVAVFFGMTVTAGALFGERGLVCWSVIATITANIEVLVLVDAFGMSMTLGNVLFASTFLVTDIISELYGKAAAKRAVHIGIFALICFIVITQSWFLYTPNSDDLISGSLREVFSNTPRVVFSSLLVYAIAQRFDVWAYHAWWDYSKKRLGNAEGWLWLRNNGSTLASQLLNTALFTLFAFWGVYDSGTLASIAVSSYVIYIFTSLLDTPFIYLARSLRKRGIKNKCES